MFHISLNPWHRLFTSGEEVKQVAAKANRCRRLQKKLNVYCSTKLKSHSLQVFSFPIVSFCLPTPQPIEQFSISNDCCKRHLTNPSSYSI